MEGYTGIAQIEDSAAAPVLTPEDMTLGADPNVGDMPCPHCRSESFRRSSRLITDVMREVFYACRNLACGHTWKASVIYEYGLSPSAIPNPALNLPLRPMPRDQACPAEPVATDPNQPGLFGD